MELIQILSKALLDIIRVDATAADNDAAYRKQMHIILDSPAVKNAIAKARDAPAPEPPKPRKSKSKPNTAE